MKAIQSPLADVRVLDFSTLLPGPLATLMLADAGADVVKIERAGAGDEARSYQPKLGDSSAIYALLNRGKRSFTADLRTAADRRTVLQLAARAQVVVEQFRPEVADRLGIGYDHIRALNPGVVYCSISGYGQHSPLRGHVGHDLNYMAQSGLLGVVTDSAGAPSLPVSSLADIAGGSYPAVVNILMGLRRSETTGAGSHLDISMTHNLQVLAFAHLASRRTGAGWPKPNAGIITGASPRYQIYPTLDGRHLAVAALEDKFWKRFTDLIELPAKFYSDEGNEERIISEVGVRVAGHTADHWRSVFAAHECCVVVVDTLDEAFGAGLTDTEVARRISGDGYDVAALPSPVSAALLNDCIYATSPGLEPLPSDVADIWGAGDAGVGSAADSASAAL